MLHSFCEGGSGNRGVGSRYWDMGDGPTRGCLASDPCCLRVNVRVVGLIQNLIWGEDGSRGGGGGGGGRLGACG